MIRPVRRRVAPRDVYLKRIWRSVIWAMLVVVIAMLVGMAGYAWLGPMSWPRAYANAAMILSGMGPLDQLTTESGMIFEGTYALICGFLFFSIAGLALAPMLHQLLFRFHLEDTDPPNGA